MAEFEHTGDSPPPIESLPPVNASAATDTPEPSDVEVPHLLQDADFQEASPAGWPAEPIRRPGPRLWEAVLWAIGVLVAQIGAGIVVAIGLLIIHLIQQGPDVLRRQGNLEKLIESETGAITVIGYGLFAMIVVIAVFLRLGGARMPRRLGLTPIPLGHAFLILFLVLPISMVVGQLYSAFDSVWKQLIELHPMLEILDQMRQQNFIEPLARNMPFPLLLLVIGVGAAVSEELVFRGVIGRGLVAHNGPAIGVLLTSLLFAAVHLHPPLVAALIPLAIVIHLLYLCTKSFFAPLLLHFLNNAWAATATKYSDWFRVQGLADEEPLPPLLLFSAIAVIVPVCLLFWKTKARYFLDNGAEWTPGYATAEQPPWQVPAERRCDRAPAWLVLVTALAVVQFVVTVSHEVIQSLRAN